MKSWLIIVIFMFPISLFGQVETDTTITIEQDFNEVKIPQDYNYQYRLALRRVRRVYPLALHAAHIIDSLEQELNATSKRRAKKKIQKNTHKELKEEFKYLLKSLYVSEGVVLSKLIYRETGMTVEEIIKKYKSGMHASLYNGLASFFDQDLDAKYDPEGEDFVLECVIQDIHNNLIPFDFSFETMDKEEYKNDRAESKARKKARKKEKRKRKREMRKKNRTEVDTASK